MQKSVSFPGLPPKVASLYNKGYALHKALNLSLIGSKPKMPKKAGRKK